MNGAAQSRPGRSTSGRASVGASRPSPPKRGSACRRASRSSNSKWVTSRRSDWSPAVSSTRRTRISRRPGEGRAPKRSNRPMHAHRRRSPRSKRRKWEHGAKRLRVRPRASSQLKWPSTKPSWTPTAPGTSSPPRPFPKRSSTTQTSRTRARLPSGTLRRRRSTNSRTARAGKTSPRRGPAPPRRGRTLGSCKRARASRTSKQPRRPSKRPRAGSSRSTS